ncbi:MAG: tetratricopeptide repeat protein [Caulobacteraceae bacterium]|nr:tetratricopeptide repeat protein [Caulobacteraceae bacterium]
MGWAVLSAALIGCGATPGRAVAADTAPPARRTVPNLPAVAPELEILAGAEALSGGHVALTSTGDADEDAVLAAMADARAGGVLAIREHEAALRGVLANMPRPFTRVRVVNDVTEYHADSMEDCLAFANGDGKAHPRFVCKGNPYAAAGFYLGSYLNEIGQAEKALAVLDAGRLAAPDAPALISERGAALIVLRRWDEVLANADRGLAVENLAAVDRARLYRSRGYALTELHRLDEAERAYRDSLTLDPDNPRANNELAYIAGLRAGQAPDAGGLISAQPTNPR